MLDWFTETGFGYLLGVAAVTLVGLVLFYRGVWGDSSKGRVRCPKCWYDMRGTVPRLECPECGHDAGLERRLYKHHRRWGRIGIGVMLMLLSAYPLTIVGGWWSEQSAMRRYELDAIASERIGPAWLVERLPDELGRFFDRVDWLGVNDRAQLGAFLGLRHVRELSVAGGDITDADFVHLRRLPKLEYLFLSKVPVTGAGLVHLQGLSKLGRLWIDARHVTDMEVLELRQALPNVHVASVWPGEIIPF